MTATAGRRLALRACLAVAAVAVTWSIATLLTGGFSTHLLGLPLRSHDATRPVILTGIALIAYAALGGRIDTTRAVTGMWLCVAVLTLGTLFVGVAFNTTAVGGSDSFGYASEAELLLRRELVVQQPFVRAVPWPGAAASFAPLGYRAGARPDQPDALTPTYPPGLPALMAAAKALGGQEALFWISPISAALLVLLTFLIGRDLASPLAGLIAAWLVATSPVPLLMAVQPMSDAPAAAAWALAFYLFTRPGVAAAAGSGAAAGLAVFIRPNLAIGVALLAAGYLAAILIREQRSRTLARAVAFIGGLAPFAASLALLNDAWNGSPFVSGYGDVTAFFSASHLLPNLRFYLATIAAQTPVVLVGLAVTLLPARALWPAARSRTPLVVAATFTASLLLFYLLYLEFSDGTALRFLLPLWPVAMAGAGATLAYFVRTDSPIVTAAAIGLTLLLGVQGIERAKAQGVFDQWKGDRRFPAVARLVADRTEPDSVILSVIHSGSLRYYGGRLTLRVDQLDGNWLDGALAWFQQRGVHPYLLLDDYEFPILKQHFASQRSVAFFDRHPRLTYRNLYETSLIDLAPNSTGPAETASAPLPRSAPPRPLAMPVW